MSGLFVFLFLLALILLPVSLIKPSIFNRFAKKDFSRKQLGLTFGALIIASLFLIGITAPPVTNQESQVKGDRVEQQTGQTNQLPVISPEPTEIATPTPSPSPSPTPKPTPTPTIAPLATITPQTYSTTPTNCLNGTYVNSAGNTVCRPEQSSTVPAGATAICRDGSYSFSQSRRGTCSYHGGVAQWL